MSLPIPELDDRAFLDLVTEARDRIARSCPEWTDLSVHDPGMALLEAFAYLTEVMIYRINRLPEKAYVAFLNLLGVTRHPPAAAWADLTFSRTGSSATGPIPIPAGTAVAAAGRADPQPVIFVSTESVAIPDGQNEVTVRAHHCELVDAELLGVGTGQPQQRFTVRRAPIATTTEPFDVLLGVEVPEGSLGEGAVAREHAGRTFEVWRQVPSFAGVDPGAKVYLLDREPGTVTFAPALDLRTPSPAAERPDLRTLAAVPPANAEIRLWYRSGGGSAGNVAAETLTALREQIAGVKVTNPRPARGGRDTEPIEAAMVRGPYELFSLQRAVTARDFEYLAVAGSAAVARARAFTRAATLSFASPGEVEVVLVPHVGAETRPDWRLPADVLLSYHVEQARLQTQQDLNDRSALGTSCLATWACYKAVSVSAKVVVQPQEDPEAVCRRIHDDLYQLISALPTPLNATGWSFGQPLRASNVYGMLERAEPGVRFVENVKFTVDEAPDRDVRALAADQTQPDTWYAGSAELLFRSTNGGTGWEPVGRFPGEQVRRVVPAPAAVRPGMIARPGAVAVLTRRSDDAGSGIYVSADLGESWVKVAELQAGVADLAWIDRDEVGALLVASDVGLYEVSLLPGAVPLQVLVDPDDADRGFYAVSSFTSERGVSGVAVAAQAQFGVYLSTDGGRQGTFGNVGLAGLDTRTVAVQYDGPATLLWVGTGEADPNRPGQGCFRARLFEADVRWETMAAGWGGGTCWDLTFAGRTVFAGTQSGGVLRLDASTGQPTWRAPDINCGLPLRDRPRFAAVEAVTAAPGGAPVLAGGPRGVYRTADGETWEPTASREIRDVVTLPDTWLLCSGEHKIEVVRQGATPGD